MQGRDTPNTKRAHYIHTRTILAKRTRRHDQISFVYYPKLLQSKSIYLDAVADTKTRPH